MSTALNVYDSSERHLLFNTSFSYLRLALDLPILLFVVGYNSLDGFADRWNDAYDTLWIHTHMAMLLFEAGILPPLLEKRVISIPRLHMLSYRYLTGIAMLADITLVYLTALDLHEYGAASGLVLRLVLTLSLHATNWWRLVEILFFTQKSAPESDDTANDDDNEAATTTDDQTQPQPVSGRLRSFFKNRRGCRQCQAKGCEKCPPCAQYRMCSTAKNCHAE